jgi:DNA polymerase I
MATKSHEITVVLVDGHNLLYRAFYGFPTRIMSKAGSDVTGVFGFFALLKAGLRQIPAPLVCIVCFDGQNGGRARQDENKDYKSNRPSLDMTPIKSLPPIKNGLDLLGLRWVELDDYEADDVIATIAARETARSIYIMSTDKDYYQVVSSRIRVLNTQQKQERRVIGPGDIKEKFGVLPHQWCDYRALIGDPSDCIRGVPGIGHKTALKLLAGDRLAQAFQAYGRSKNWQIDKVETLWQQVLSARRLLLLRSDLENVPDLRPEVQPEIPNAAAILEALGVW